jgi:hypothetical protein
MRRPEHSGHACWGPARSHAGDLTPPAPGRREIDLPIIYHFHKFLVSPTPRTALALGKALSAGIRGPTQGVIVYLLAILLSVRVDWHPLSLLGVLATVMLGAAFFSTFSLVIACIVKTRSV